MEEGLIPKAAIQQRPRQANQTPNPMELMGTDAIYKTEYHSA